MGSIPIGHILRCLMNTYYIYKFYNIRQGSNSSIELRCNNLSFVKSYLQRLGYSRISICLNTNKMFVYRENKRSRGRFIREEFYIDRRVDKVGS